jgi:hypothetical protein
MAIPIPPLAHAAHGAATHAHAGQGIDLLRLQPESGALRLELVSQGVDFLLFGLNL